MRLFKTHSHISNGLAMEPGTLEEKQLKESQTLQQGKSTHQKPTTYRRCGGGGQKRLCNLPILPVWRGGGRKGSTANPPQKNWYGGGG